MDTIQASSSSSSGNSDFNSVSATECGHVFHDVCLRRWLAASRSCPTCRKQLRPERIVKLYIDGAALLPHGCIRNSDDRSQRLQREMRLLISQLEAAAAAEQTQKEAYVALRREMRRIEGIARMYNSKYANMLRENHRLRTQLRASREEARDLRNAHRDNSLLQNQLCTRDRQLEICEELQSRSEHAIHGLSARLALRDSLIRQQAQQIQAQQDALNCVNFTLSGLQWIPPPERPEDQPHSVSGRALKRPRLGE